MVDRPKTYAQAQRLIRRVMEGAGGSADAYEEGPEEDPGVVVEKPVALPAKSTLGADIQAAMDRLDDDEPNICVVGILDDIDDSGKFPPPLNDHYEYHSVVEAPACAELRKIYVAFATALRTGSSQQIELNSGPVTIEQGEIPYPEQDTIDTWILEEEAIDRRYYLEPYPQVLADFINQSKDIFIWVLDSRSDRRLGYIYEGYVYLRVTED